MNKKKGMLLGLFAMVFAGSVWNVPAAASAGMNGYGEQMESGEAYPLPEVTDSLEEDQTAQEAERESRAVTFSDSIATYQVLTEGENPTVAVIKVKGVVQYNPDGSFYEIFRTQNPSEPWYVTYKGVSYAVTEMKGEDLFYRIRDVTIPEGVKVLGYRTLWGSDIEKLYLPSTLEQFDTNHALYQVEQLEVSAENPYYSSQDNVLFNKDKSELILYAPGQKQTEYEPPEAVKVIKFNAFYNNNYLEELYLPKVEEIEEYAFCQMQNIRNIYIGKNLKTYQSMYTTYFCTKLENIFVDDDNEYGFYDDEGVFYLGRNKVIMLVAYPANHQSSSYMIPYGTTALGVQSFCCTAYTTEISIPATCVNIGSLTFQFPSIPMDLIFQHVTANKISWNTFTSLIPGSQVIFAKDEYIKNVDGAAFLFKNEEGYLKPDPNPPIVIDYERAVSRMDNWYEKDGKTYHYDESGQLLKDGIYNVWGQDYGFDPEGALCQGLVEYAGKTYYFEEGVLQGLTGIQTLDGERYFFQEDFSICKDSQITDWGITYYIDPKTGKVICDSENHQYGAWTSIEEATCLQAGLHRRTCSNCGYQDEQMVPKTDHLFGAWEVKAISTCTAYGTRSRTCTICQTVITESLPLIGHTFGAWSVTMAPSYTMDGCKVRSCSVCGWTDVTSIPKLPRTSIRQAKIGKISRQVYNGTSRTPNITVKVNGAKLKKGRDYTISYQNNKLPGKAIITIQGTGAYTGLRNAVFQILPKKPVKLKVTAAKGKLTVTFPKVEKITGYQVSCSTSKKFTAKTTKVINSKKNKAVFKKIKAKRNYYIRVRAYKKVGGERLYSAISKAIKKYCSE